MLRRTLLAAGFMGLVAGASAPSFAEELKELNFGIISTETSQNLKTVWQPFLADMEKGIGMKVNAFFATDYAGVIEAMRFNKVQVAWYGNKSAMEAVDRADGDIFVQSTDKDGKPGYWSLIIVNKDSEIKTLDDLLKNGGKYTFGNGDPNSTSGFLVPSYYVFAKNNVDPKKLFKRMVSANHETNALAVASKQVDAATNNTESMDRLETTAPEKAKEIRVIWKSPVIPNDPIVWRKDLPDAVKQKLKAFFLHYGVKGSPAELDRAKTVLAGLHWGPFKASNNLQLIPIRQLELFRERTKLVNDETVPEADKNAKLAEFDAKLDALAKQAAGS
jgi:phosphonate transport system substrate-binding protein